MKRMLAALLVAMAEFAGLAYAAGAANDPTAALRLGLAYRNGSGRAVDPVAARLCLREAADGGEPAAMFLLSHMLADGEGGPPDAAAARTWLERAAGLDYPEALQELALAEPDPERAALLMRAAAHALEHRAHAARHALQRN